MRRDLVAIRRKLSAQRDHWRAIEERLGDTGDEVRRPRSERAHAHAGDPARGRHRVCHERGRRLVASEHELEPGLAEALDEVDDLATRVAEDMAHAGGAKAISDEPADGGDSARIRSPRDLPVEDEDGRDSGE